jgi:hypothetical protein
VFALVCVDERRKHIQFVKFRRTWLGGKQYANACESLDVIAIGAKWLDHGAANVEGLNASPPTVSAPLSRPTDNQESFGGRLSEYEISGFQPGSRR